MVTTTDTTDIVTQPKLEEHAQPSFKRWLKHFFYMPATKRFFSKQDQHAIALAVEEAEHGHVGEIQVVIEGSLPSRSAYYQDTLCRARQLFAELGVWDTEHNSGVLLYLNLCDHKVEIVIDRGIKQATTQDVWDEICQNIIQELKQGNYKNGVILGVKQIGEILNQYYDQKMNDLKNELGNKPIILG
ncbi:TPM domain-containing protein [Acinetobacter variabilis]|uniref:TPM domain-containing protein n=1 Tax=Acinetobacter variabilis TaxID=70346 RepID=UPI001ABCB2C6|nr:TPM domain-containing protein [Acinetobacter variabilis]MBO3661256.1 TPM domain-containing protein [Acinetobacter variabilis]MCU4312556.1 TPM domain-containing protein [Acinetobacter variabilis]